ncbi:hypothetical protein WS70_08560 [Burkholderia mayonis]|uniref:Uncharacterized protein n=1 Tax=Burkholderia mayonis TaxID=1385591 RepID=A0A1B4FDX4_9BURK|nr:hypothetical protein WS70_08560 [Burkholderia mayonis]KVE43092.1 hypothetical protein WS69_23755 [Burkholderia sp. BDU5]KVE47264.1 hypothetical protein WS70_25860 [Burkholderia mayonis]
MARGRIRLTDGGAAVVGGAGRRVIDIRTGTFASLGTATERSNFYAAAPLVAHPRRIDGLGFAGDGVRARRAR